MRTSLPALPGVYALILLCPRERWIAVGALGVRRFSAGWYVYVGSAWGPGGLRGRAGRHLRGRRVAPRWHIDFLHRAATVRELWFLPGAPAQVEHRVAAFFAGFPEVSVPVLRFGASDCRCRAHLFAFAARPRPEPLAAGLHGLAGPGREPLRIFSLPPPARGSRQRPGNGL